MSSKIPVFLASDDNYAPFLCTTIYSILEKTESFISFYVLDAGISEQNKYKIEQSLCGFTEYSLNYCNMSHYDLNRFPDLGHYSVITFARYFIPEICPDLGKVIYMDVDTIVNGDIQKLYDEELGEYALGAVLEDFYGANHMHLKKKIFPQYAGGSRYFNAGVMLIDIQRFNKYKYMDKAIELTLKHKAVLACPDQDIFNIVFENNFMCLDYRYNFMPDHYPLLEALNPQKAIETKNNALIYHFTGPKPWKAYSVEEEKFWRVLSKTKFKDDIRRPCSFCERTSQTYLFGIIRVIKIKSTKTKTKTKCFYVLGMRLLKIKGASPIVKQTVGSRKIFNCILLSAHRFLRL